MKEIIKKLFIFSGLLFMTSAFIVLSGDKVIADEVTIDKSIVALKVGIEANDRFYPVRNMTGFLIADSGDTYYILSLSDKTALSDEEYAQTLAANGIPEDAYGVEEAVYVVIHQDVIEPLETVTRSESDNYAIFRCGDILNEAEPARIYDVDTNYENIKKDGRRSGEPVTNGEGYVVGIANETEQGIDVVYIDNVIGVLDNFGIPYRGKAYDMAYDELIDEYDTAFLKYENNKYKSDSKEALEEALEEAANLLENDSPDIDEMNAVVADLKAAEDALQKKTPVLIRLKFILGAIDIILLLLLIRIIILRILEKRSSDEATEPASTVTVSGTATLYNRRTGKYYPINKDSYTIGRQEESVDAYIPDNPRVGRVHATIRRSGNQYRIFDRESTNGTFVNGEQVCSEGRLLADQNIIRLADEEFIITIR